MNLIWAVLPCFYTGAMFCAVAAAVTATALSTVRQHRSSNVERSAAETVPATDAELAAVSMDDLIGNTDHFKTSRGTITVRGLEVAWWRYENESLAHLNMRPVVALHGGPVPPMLLCAVCNSSPLPCCQCCTPAVRCV